MGDAIADLPVKSRTAKASALLSLKRTFDLFSGNFNFGQRTSADAESQKIKLACKVSTLLHGLLKTQGLSGMYS